MDLSSGDNNFVDATSAYLKEGKTAQVLTLYSAKNKDEICNYSWELIPIICTYLTQEFEFDKREVFQCAKELIKILCDYSNPEEILLQFIEEFELAQDNTKFISLLEPLEMLLVKIPDKRVTSLAWCFNAIMNYLQKVEAPEEYNFQIEERLLLDSSDDAVKIVLLYEYLIDFCETFVNEVLNLQSINTLERKQVLGKFLIDLLGKPLCFLNMEEYKTTKPKARVIAESLIINFFKLHLNPMDFLEQPNLNADLIQPTNLALGVFYNLVFCTQVCLEKISNVYSSIYVLHNCLKFVNSLLFESSIFLVERGIFLMDTLLKSIDCLELPYLLLESEEHNKFCVNISNVIIHNDIKTLRQKSLEIMQKYLWSFEHQGRYLIIKSIMRVLTHSGLKGNIIIQYKEMLTEQIKHSRKGLPKYYTGAKLTNLLDQFTLLEKKEESDLVDASDQIVSTLNLLRYLVIINKTMDNGINSYLNGLEDGYFKYLTAGVSLSKEHYLLRIKEITEESCHHPKKQNDVQVSLSVGGNNLFEMPTEKKIEVLNMSLTTLDVIDSLLNRVMECINCERSCNANK